MRPGLPGNRDHLRFRLRQGLGTDSLITTDVKDVWWDGVVWAYLG
jgi:hypothetical protein